MAAKNNISSKNGGIDRRKFLQMTASTGAVIAGNLAAGPFQAKAMASKQRKEKTTDAKPNVLFLMTDQQRLDTIRALGNSDIYTPNIDRLVRRGLTFNNAYSTCPVCVPARYTIRTGRQEPTTRVFTNAVSEPAAGQKTGMEERCGKFLARTMTEHGYRTFGIGKFHTQPDWFKDLGYEVHLHSEEVYLTASQRKRDAFASWIATEHPEYDFIEGLMGERSEMYYMPQMSAMPAECTVERWAADSAIEQINKKDKRPYFGFVSFVGPHPPFAPPIPYNRMYDPDRMPNPVKSDIETDHMDEQITWMNHVIWAEGISESHARVLKARYYGEITYIDDCIGRILDAIEAREDGDNTLICFFSDHGDHLGDHNAWQKESFFDVSCNVPFLVSWPAKLTKNQRRDELVCLADLFGIATKAAGQMQTRDGVDLLGVVEGKANPREHVVGYYGEPGTAVFKIMIREARWKYIFMANGGRTQLFDMLNDPYELNNLATTKPDVVKQLHKKAVSACMTPGAADAIENDDLKKFPFEKREMFRAYQFDNSRGVLGFPDKPEDVLKPSKKK